MLPAWSAVLAARSAGKASPAVPQFQILWLVAWMERSDKTGRSRMSLRSVRATVPVARLGPALHQRKSGLAREVDDADP